MNGSSTAKVVRKRGSVVTLVAIVCGLVHTSHATAATDGAMSLQRARMALQRYALDPNGTNTLPVIAELEQLAHSPELSPIEQTEARFVAAAAASDLLLLAQLRGDRALVPALETALHLEPGTALNHFDTQLASMSRPGYREAAMEMRKSIALLRDGNSPSLARFHGVSGSQRDLLFVDALTHAATLPGNTVAALASYGEDPCAATEKCEAPYAAFDASGRMAVAALAEAGRAMNRLHSAAKEGDPLARSAAIELAAFDSTLPAIDVQPTPGAVQDSTSMIDDADGPFASASRLLFKVSENDVSYGFVPGARLGDGYRIELFANGTPMLPEMTSLAAHGASQSLVVPLPELVAFVQQQLAQNPQLGLAMTATPGVSAQRLGSALMSVKRAGRSELLLIGRNAHGEAAAQRVQLAQSTDAGFQESSELALRVRLGGYSLRASNGALQDIPRVRDANGFRFDSATLDTQLASLHVKSSQVSFMSDVAAENVTVALLEVARSSRATALVLP